MFLCYFSRLFVTNFPHFSGIFKYYIKLNKSLKIRNFMMQLKLFFMLQASSVFPGSIQPEYLRLCRRKLSASSVHTLLDAIKQGKHHTTKQRRRKIPHFENFNQFMCVNAIETLKNNHFFMILMFYPGS